MTEEEIKNSSIFKMMTDQIKKSEIKQLEMLVEEFAKAPKTLWTKTEIVELLSELVRQIKEMDHE